MSVARGEQEYFDPSGIPTATEACKSNALMRCCKDLGIASELWSVEIANPRVIPDVSRDPSFIRTFKTKHCAEAFVEHQVTKKKCVAVLRHVVIRLMSFLGESFGARRTPNSSTRTRRLEVYLSVYVFLLPIVHTA